jgi:transposase-like protein
MPRGFPSLTPEQKQDIIKRVKEQGERVSDLAKEYGVTPNTIYNLLKGQITNSNTLLELAKLKREKEALLKIIGQLVADQSVGKKT